MKPPFRVTEPLLDVLRALVAAERGMHGWELAQEAGQTGPNVYRGLERLRLAGWVDYWWEAQNPHPGKPRRRFFRLTDDGLAAAEALLAERAQRRLRKVPKIKINPVINALISLFLCGSQR
jgi:DNA-binding PadR family transcriptional regulator